MFDNRMWILSHIHNSFVSSDDTGVCEMVLSPETFREDMTHVAEAEKPVSFLDAPLFQSFNVQIISKGKVTNLCVSFFT